MPIPSRYLKTNRIGFHYFPDSEHFREDDLALWIPRLKSLDCSWLTLFAPCERAIPENFITCLISHDITPILHLILPYDPPPDAESIKVLIESYSKWGVRFAVIFDQPNNRSSWLASAWSRSDLVERFLDRFIPIADISLANGITPIFPPLSPGGDYWDTSFLRYSLLGLQRRKSERILDELVIGAYARARDKSLEWGRGGPERWPNAKPYFTPDGSQDHRGFCIFEWYLSISESTVGMRLPMILFGLQSSFSAPETVKEITNEDIQATLAMAECLLQRESRAMISNPASAKNNSINPLPEEIIAGNFWLLSTDAKSPYAQDAWFSPNGDGSVRAVAFEKLLHGLKSNFSKYSSHHRQADSFVIEHYLLLPSSSWGITEYYLNLARPLIRREMPVIGFSIDEARYARTITVFGDAYYFPDALLDDLRQAGSLVRRVEPDGINVASIFGDHKTEAFND